MHGCSKETEELIYMCETKVQKKLERLISNFYLWAHRYTIHFKLLPRPVWKISAFWFCRFAVLPKPSLLTKATQHIISLQFINSICFSFHDPILHIKLCFFVHCTALDVFSWPDLTTEITDNDLHYNMKNEKKFPFFLLFTGNELNLK